MSRFAAIAAVVLLSTLGVSWLLNASSNYPTIGDGLIGSIYNPVQAGEPTPAGFRSLLSRDAIAPIYEPTFRTASETTWHDATLVIGVEIDGDARAYPVSFLNRREIVNDHVGKTPVLVTW